MYIWGAVSGCASCAVSLCVCEQQQQLHLGASIVVEGQIDFTAVDEISPLLLFSVGSDASYNSPLALANLPAVGSQR